MSVTKRSRSTKKQLGQFITPDKLAKKIVDRVIFLPNTKVLEPSFGDGAFIGPILENIEKHYSQKSEEKPILHGVEIDGEFFEKCKNRFSLQLKNNNVVLEKNDFFFWHPTIKSYVPKKNDHMTLKWEYFDYIIGNPPFGGTFDSRIEDELDDIYGKRDGEKIKKETYAFFIVKSVDLLKPNGKLVFICSDTFLSINTMKGLRKYLMKNGSVEIETLSDFSDETDYPMILITFVKGEFSEYLTKDGKKISQTLIEKTPNFSWTIQESMEQYFSGPLLREFVVCTSGMTIGKNEYFLKEIEKGNTILERFDYTFSEKKITLENEITRARLGKLSEAKKAEIMEKERLGATKRTIVVTEKSVPERIQLPDNRYCYYNKASSEIIFTPPKTVVYWENEGEAVLNFKKTGAWYLHGVGGQKFFKREGLSWQLIASKIKARYLPEGYILDSGAPCAFLRPGLDHSELYFILAWLLSPLATEILKTTLNHTHNIQSKDIERLPYPWWVAESKKKTLAHEMKKMVSLAQDGALSKSQKEAFVASLDLVFAAPR